MRGWLHPAAAALLAALAWQPAAAAPANPAPAAQPQKPAAAPEFITFEQYRAYRLQLIANRQASLAKRLAATDLAPPARARLERVKGYYDAWAAMPASERDRRFRSRFEAIDGDHDGTISAAERAQWRDRERARYRQLAAERAAASQQQ